MSQEAISAVAEEQQVVEDNLETPDEQPTETTEGTEQQPDTVENAPEGSEEEAQEALEKAGAEDTGRTDEAGEKLYTVKVNGEDIEVTEEELLKGYRMAQASNQRFEEAAKLRKEVESIQELMKTNPAKAMEQLGLDPREFSEEYISRLLEEQMMTPEERKAAEMQRELEEYRSKERSEKERREQEEYEENTAKQAEVYRNQIETAIAENGLKHTPATINRIVGYMEQAYNMGNTDVTAQDVIGQVKDEYYQDLREQAENLSVEDLTKVLGDSIIKKIRQFDTSRLKNPKGETPKAQASSAKPKKRDDRNVKKEVQDFWNNLID